MEEGLRPFSAKVAEEAGGRVFDRGVLARRLYAFREHRTEIQALAESILDEMAGSVEALESMGYPFAPAELRLSRESIMLPFRNVRLLRQRYSSFDLAYELGLESLLLEQGEKYLGA
jgi:glycerol-1-phosphate dehydrogenase [NAD(P)+]